MANRSGVAADDAWTLHCTNQRPYYDPAAGAHPWHRVFQKGKMQNVGAEKEIEGRNLSSVA